MGNLTYFSSERFIHDDLMARAAAIADETRETWKKTRRCDAYAITWPSETLRADNGGAIENAVICQFPALFDEAQRMETLRKMVERTKAYGLVLIEKKDDVLRVLFETHHGARAWLIPLERHGDVLVCGTPEVRNNADCVGLLWRSSRGSS